MSKGMDTYDYLADFFGARQYENYKFQMREIEKLKEKKKQVDRDLRLLNGGFRRDLRELINSYQKLIDNLDTKNYGWNGDDMRAAWRKLLEMRDEVKAFPGDLNRAADSIMAAMDEKCRKHGDAARRAIRSFNILDKAIGSVDVGLQTARDHLIRLSMEMEP